HRVARSTSGIVAIGIKIRSETLANKPPGFIIIEPLIGRELFIADLGGSDFEVGRMTLMIHSLPGTRPFIMELANPLQWRASEAIFGLDLADFFIKPFKPDEPIDVALFTRQVLPGNMAVYLAIGGPVPGEEAQEIAERKGRLRTGRLASQFARFGNRLA